MALEIESLNGSQIKEMVRKKLIEGVDGISQCSGLDGLHDQISKIKAIIKELSRDYVRTKFAKHKAKVMDHEVFKGTEEDKFKSDTRKSSWIVDSGASSRMT